MRSARKGPDKNRSTFGRRPARNPGARGGPPDRHDRRREPEAVALGARSSHADAAIVLAPGRDKSIARRHPWIFSGAIAQVAGAPQSGQTVQVLSSDGRFLAWAAFSAHSQIRARIWTWEQAETIDAAFIERRVALSIGRRGTTIRDSGVRLINAEADQLPGLVVDRYATVGVVQFLSAGAEFWRDAIVHALQKHGECDSLYERSDVEVRALEGMASRAGLLAGSEPPEFVNIVEGRSRFQVDIRHGHKTGFYLDQAHNRARIAALSAGRSVLNCFCYTGGFSIAALSGGAARAVSIDSSAEALALARTHERCNAVGPGRAEWREADVFAELRKLRHAAERFDLIVLDPPKFAPTAAHVQRAARAYKDINLLAFQLLRPGGLLATFSCSGAIDAALFQSIVAGAAQDAGVETQLVERFGAAPDHVVALNFPEGEYLKGLLVKRR